MEQRAPSRQLRYRRSGQVRYMRSRQVRYMPLEVLRWCPPSQLRRMPLECRGCGRRLINVHALASLNWLGVGVSVPHTDL